MFNTQFLKTEEKSVNSIAKKKNRQDMEKSQEKIQMALNLNSIFRNHF